MVERGLALADLHLGGGEAGGTGPLGQPAHGEGLARAVLAPDGLEPGPAGGHVAQVVVEGLGEALGTDGEGGEAALGDRSPP